MLTSPDNAPHLDLQAGPHWSSFEQFRTTGATALSSVKSGTVATLQTKTGSYRVLEEQDFQKLLGLARDVERLRGGLRVVVQAIHVAQKHPDPDSLNLLTEVVTLLSDLPGLPTRDHFDTLVPENLDFDPEDEATLDPQQIQRPLTHTDLKTHPRL
jgi:hypothetical protein